MNKIKNAIMIADTRIPLIGHLLLQIKKTNPNLFDEAIIYYEEISNKDKEVIKGIMPCKFKKFNYNLPENVKNLPAFKKFSQLMFSRYYLFDYLNEYNTVTWIDTDVLITGDISSILAKANKTGMCANFEDPINKSYLTTDVVKTSFYNPVSGYDMTKYNMSSGLLTVSRKLKNYDVMTKWCFDKTIEFANNLVLPDQGILNLLIQEFKINVTSLGENGAYCFYPIYKKDSSKAKVIHSWGARKFWKSWYLYNKYPAWKEFYNDWLELGGSDYFGEIKPDVSVVIPSYNTNVHYFDFVLNDLLVKQVQEHNFQYDNFEIILVIDGEISKDLDNLIKEYDDPRLVIIHNEERCGIAKSLNIGIKSSKGRYIARIDDDDRINFNRLYKQVKYLDEHKDIDLVSSYFEYFGDLNESRVTLSGELCRAWSIFSCPFDHPTIMFRKDFMVKNNLFYDETRSHVEDWELWLRCFDNGMKMDVIKEVLYYHRWYNGQAGQNVKTVEMMRDLVRKNFEKLDISLTDEELVYISPWQGRVDEEKFIRLNEIYSKALENNLKYKIYDQNALETVFSYRLDEAKTGKLANLVFGKSNNIDFDSMELFKSQNIRSKFIKLNIKKLLRPLYKPIRRVFYNITAEAICDNLIHQNNKLNQMESNITNQANTLNESLQEELNDTNKKFDLVFEKLNKLENSTIEVKDSLHNELYDINKKFDLLYDENVNSLYFKNKIFLIGTSEHGNLGDAAITMGIREFIRENFKNYYFIEISTYDFSDRLSYLQKIINIDDIILLQGGGNLGNRYLNEENVRRTVIEKFPNNNIYILPQTIYFDDSGSDELEKSIKIYNQHKHLTIFARGKISLENANKYFNNSKNYLSIDSALYLHMDYNFERKGILCCIRDLDDESALDNVKYTKLLNIIKSFDNNYSFTTNTSKESIKKMNLSQEVYNQLENFAKHKLIITDRLHGLIFAIITNTPCIVLSSYNFKIKENYEMLKDNKTIFFIDKDIDSLNSIIKKCLSMKLNNYKNDYKKDFAEMASIIKGNKDNK